VHITLEQVVCEREEGGNQSLQIMAGCTLIFICFKIIQSSVPVVINNVVIYFIYVKLKKGPF
jgi:hypothetical protein